MNKTEEPVETDDTGRPCGITAIFPNGISCRGRAEAFARRLQSRLRTLGSQDEPTSPTNNENTWLTHNEQENGRSPGATTIIQSYQPIRLGITTTTLPNNDNTLAADSYYDFDMEPESPGSPIDECEYTRLIETTTTTPNELTAPESGCVCSSPSSMTRSSTEESAGGRMSSQSSQSSSEGLQYYDPEMSDNDQSKSLSQGDYFDCMEFRKEAILSNMAKSIPYTQQNGHMPSAATVFSHKLSAVRTESSDSCSDSLPPSQSTDSNHTWTPQQSSNSNSTLQDEFVVSEEETPEQEKQQPVERDVVDSVAPVYMNRTAVTDGDDEETAQMTDNSSSPMVCNGCPINKAVRLNFGGTYDDEGLTELEHIKFIVDIPVPSKTIEDVADHDKNVEHLTTVVEENDDDIDEFERPPRIQRSSSLKTGKTPPGTPGRKKIVRFADVLGLDLADVRTFLDEVPKIPKYVYEDLHTIVALVNTDVSQVRVDRVLMPLFQQPSALPDFLDHVREKQVCLENACVADPVSMSIIGSVRVRNLDFHKSVYIRYTTDSWRNFSDLQANYVENSCDGFSDRFTFMLYANSLKVADRLEMSIRFHCKGQQFWDNNYGANYCFQCLAGTTTGNSQTPAVVVNCGMQKSASCSRSGEAWEGGAFY